MQSFGTIVIVGGGCYGSYYLRQLGRARRAGAVEWARLVVVDRDPHCRVAVEPQPDQPALVLQDWATYLGEYLAAAAGEPDRAVSDAIVPSPLMPHLLFDWLLGRARERCQGRDVRARPLAAAPVVPWQRASPSGETHYVSFAEWMCPINCIEPERCPATREARDWTMPAALAGYVASERDAGHFLEGPLVFHCVHRAFGVGMIDVAAVLEADRRIAIAESTAGPIEFLVGTVSHCHGALGVISIGG